MPLRMVLYIAAMLISATAAQAHTGISDTSGLSHGFTHPISGIDHLLAMVAVGLFAAHLGGRALWLVPLSFVSTMIVGGALGVTGVYVPLVEIGIGLSVVVLGIAVAYGFNIPTAAAMALVGFFAIFHGYAHGAEMPATVSGFDYGLGFMLATASLHGVGIGLRWLIHTIMGSQRITQVAGGVMALCGVGLLTQLI
jgi:urease accessory protein